MAFTQVSCTGTVMLSNATPANGAVVSLLLNTPITDGTQIVAPEPVTTRCASDGTFSVTVNANDDSTTLPTGSWYEVTITYGNQTLDSFNVSVPAADAPTVNLFSLAQLVNPTASFPFVQKIVAGTNVTISPTNGTGSVTVNSSGGGASANVVNLGNITGTVTCNLASGTCFTGTLTGNVTINFSNWPASPALTEPLLILTQDTFGGHTIAITGAIWEPDGTPPAFNTAPSTVNVIPLSSPDQGTHLYGNSGGGGVELAGDLGGTNASPVVETVLAGKTPLTSDEVNAANGVAGLTSSKLLLPTVQPAAPVAWTPYPGNPLWPKSTFTGAAALAAWTDVWYDGTTFHAFVAVDGTSAGIYHGSSADGLTGWTFDATPALSVGTAGAWDQTAVTVPNVFAVGSTLHMYYRGMSGGTSKIGHATTSTSTPGGPWTKDAGNPLIDGSTAPGFMNGNIESGCGRTILYNGTYYMWVSQINGGTATQPRCATVYTATAPGGPWTVLAGTYGTTNPIFTGGRFCNSIWTDGSWFYSIVPCYRAGFLASVIGGTQAHLELWRASEPTFQPSNREFVGVLRSASLVNAWEANQFDTPTVLCDDVTRSTFSCTGGRPRIYYAGQDASGNFLTGALVPANQLITPQARSEPIQILGPWNTTTVTASQTNVQVPLLGGGLSWVSIPFRCSLVTVGISAGQTGHVTAGTATATATVAGVATTLTAQLTATNKSYVSTRAEAGTIVLGPGQLLGVQLTTSASYAGTNTQLDMTLGVIPW